MALPCISLARGGSSRHRTAMKQDLGLIGFGEAALAFAEAAKWAGRAIAWDVDPKRAQAMASCAVDCAADAADALAQVRMALSLVTADQALAAVREYAAYIVPGTIWCDMNSVAPETKLAAAEIVEAAGGRYVDVAVMAPVHPARTTVPLLVSGKAAQDAAQRLATLGFTNIRIVGKDIGRASAIKMIRSVLVKGLEALTDEMMAAADAAGVTDEVLASLDTSEKTMPWTERAAYNLERMQTHGLRRAAEMEESAKTLRSLGVEPVMTDGTVRRQRDAARPKSSMKDAA